MASGEPLTSISTAPQKHLPINFIINPRALFNEREQSTGAVKNLGLSRPTVGVMRQSAAPACVLTVTLSSDRRTPDGYRSGNKMPGRGMRQVGKDGLVSFHWHRT